MPPQAKGRSRCGARPPRHRCRQGTRIRPHHLGAGLGLPSAPAADFAPSTSNLCGPPRESAGYATRLRRSATFKAAPYPHARWHLKPRDRGAGVGGGCVVEPRVATRTGPWFRLLCGRHGPKLAPPLGRVGPRRLFCGKRATLARRTKTPVLRQARVWSPRASIGPPNPGLGAQRLGLRKLHDVVDRILWKRVRVQLNWGKTRVWNAAASHRRPPKRSREPGWGRALPLHQQGLTVLGTPPAAQACDELTTHFGSLSQASRALLLLTSRTGPHAARALAVLPMKTSSFPARNSDCCCCGSCGCLCRWRRMRANAGAP